MTDTDLTADFARPTAAYDRAEAALIAAGATTADLSHDCDETDPACDCDEPHAPGDLRCANRHRHSPCSHDHDLAARLGITLP